MKLIALGLGFFFTLLAGAVIAAGNLFGLLPLIGGGAFILSYGKECQNEGAEPLTELKPGRKYCVEAVLHWREEFACLVVSWHDDWGHLFRITELPRHRFAGMPRTGDRITVEPHTGMYELR